MTNPHLGVLISAGELTPADIGKLVLVRDPLQWGEIYAVDHYPASPGTAYYKPYTVIGYMPRRWIRKRRHIVVKVYSDSHVRIRR